MMKKLLFILLVLMSVSIYAEKYGSRYSSIKEKDCKLVEYIEVGGSTRSVCPSFGKFGVEVYGGDLRQAVFINRNGREYPLNTWTSGFSKLGSVIEWRYKKGKSRKVVGVIFRVNINDHPNNPDKVTSYLYVNKITPGEICLVGIIAPHPKQNIKARKLAEIAPEVPCID